ncbi:MAG: YbaK/EbsC family protein [Candidatus Colwellbacteria bacterium]|nr:YbaK/EbsC family protein [Candidatus Colwellbacteria bacterium]
MLPIEHLLREKGVPYALIPLAKQAFTVEDVVKYAGVPVPRDEICKTIITEGEKSGKRRAIFLRGGDRIDRAKAKRIFGESVGMADADGVREASSVEPGAVCPFMLRVPLYVDERVLRLHKANSGSGDLRHGLEFTLENFKKAVTFEAVDIARSDEDS